MTKVDDAKIEIIKNLEAKEYTVGADFDGSVADVKPLGWTFYRINILYKNADGEATFGAKGVYVKTDGTYLFHSGGVRFNQLESKTKTPNPFACDAGGVCEYKENSKGKYYCVKCLKIKE